MLASNIEILSLAGLIGLAVVISLAGLLVARWLMGWIQRDVPRDAFTLQDLREMRDRGDISETEFNTMRQEILAAYAGRGAQAGSDGADDPDSAAGPPAQAR